MNRAVNFFYVTGKRNSQQKMLLITLITKKNILKQVHVSVLSVQVSGENLRHY